METIFEQVYWRNGSFLFKCLCGYCAHVCGCQISNLWLAKVRCFHLNMRFFVLQNLSLFVGFIWICFFLKNASMSGKIPDRIWRVVLGQMYYFRARVERVGDILHRKWVINYQRKEPQMHLLPDTQRGPNLKRQKKSHLHSLWIQSVHKRTLVAFYFPFVDWQHWIASELAIHSCGWEFKP